MGTIVAIVNNKGGVGKTTLTVNLAHALANRGKRVLIVDNDAQCNASSLLVDADVVTDSLYELYADDETPIERCIYPTAYENLSILPNSEETAALEIQLNRSIPVSYLRLRQRLRNYAASNFDFAFIDTPPNWGYFVLATLHAADCVIVPILCSSRFSMEGLTRALSLIETVRDRENPDLRLLRLLVNNVDKRTAISKVVIDKLGQLFAEDVLFKTSIPTNTQFSQAEMEGKSIIRFSPRSVGAKYYRALAVEFLKLFPSE
jgi:cellulose biosynthesis protein BcsQ